MTERGNGFTLVEMLVAVLIFSIVSLALGTLFSSAVQMWKRVTFDKGREEITIALAEMVERAAQARPFSPLAEETSPSSELSFAGLIRGESGAPELGQVRYLVDSQKRLLLEERNYSQIQKGESGRQLERAHSVEAMEVQSLFFNPLSGRFQTEPVLGVASKEMKPVPDAHRLILRFKTADGKLHALDRVY